MIFIGWENFVVSIGVGPSTSIPIISPLLLRSRMRLSEIGSLSATFPFFSRMYSALQLESYSSEAKPF